MNNNLKKKHEDEKYYRRLVVNDTKKNSKIKNFAKISYCVGYILNSSLLENLQYKVCNSICNAC